MVVEVPKMIILPRPKKKFAIMGTIQITPFSAVHPYHIKAAGNATAANQAFSLSLSSGCRINFPDSSYRPAARASLCMIVSVHFPPKTDASTYPRELGIYKRPTIMTLKLYGDSEKVC